MEVLDRTWYPVLIMIAAPFAHAKFKERVLAFMLDYLLIALWLIMIVSVGIGIRSGFFESIEWLFGTALRAQISGFLMVTLPVSLYFTLCEASPYQATWGKSRRGLKVVNRLGQRLSLPRAFARTLLKFIPWELAHTCIWQLNFHPQDPPRWITVGFLLVWILIGANLVSLLLSQQGQTVYDRLVNSVVIRATPRGA